MLINVIISEREEAFREEMRIAREKMQKLYNEKMKK